LNQIKRNRIVPPEIALKEENMRILAGLTIAAALIATGAAAQPGRLSDVSFMEAARCAGLASSGKLGAGDAAALKALVKSQSAGRDGYILDKADELQAQAERDASHADDYMKAKLTAELNGACAALKS
jgi:hypothetical protein